ncbi:unnamed protein product [marine sediment metagenome]|uniref:Uncharacterized protein n=1 Tax=marine sediment metagenome TaxID=412755 RepID=X1B4X9_9ZZZZ
MLATKIKQQEQVFNDIFKEINSQRSLFDPGNQNEGDSYDLTVVNLCSLLNCNTFVLFKINYVFAMKILTSKAQVDANLYIKSKLKQGANGNL